MDNDRIVEIGARASHEESALMAAEDGDSRWIGTPFVGAQADAHMRLMRAVLAAFEEAGLVVVPAEPTPEMRQLGGEFNCPTETLTSACDYAVDVYKAMVRIAQGKEPGYVAAAKADPQ